MSTNENIALEEILRFKDFREGAAQGSAQFTAEGRPPQFEAGSVVGSGAFTAPELFYITMAAQTDADLPAWWRRERDFKLREYMRRSNDGLTVGAISGEVTRVKNMPWKLESASGNQEEVKYYQDILNFANFGKGFDVLLNNTAFDAMCSDNGFFIELIPKRAKREQIDGPSEQFPTGGYVALPIDKNEIAGISAMDSRQCWRTFSPEWPVIYVNPWSGQYTIYHWTRVIARSQFEQPDELARGLGFCAMSRIFFAARFLHAMTSYYYEKVSGGGSAIGFLRNISKEQFLTALRGGNLQIGQNGNAVYPGIVWIGGLNPELELSAELFSPKSLPDGFDHKNEWEMAAQIIALGLGVEVREIISLSGGGLGQSKGEAEIQHGNASRKGREDILKLISTPLNTRVLPDGMSFTFDQKDDAEDERKARIKQIRVSTRSQQVMSGELMAEEARIMAAQEGDINPEFLENEYVARDDTDTGADPAISESEDSEGEQEEEKARKALTENNEGVMVAFYLPLEVAVTLHDAIRPHFAIPCSPQDMHLTLAYLGDKSNLEAQKADILRTVGGVLDSMPFTPITGKIGGIGRFMKKEEQDTNAVYATFDSVELPPYRERIVAALRENNLLPPQNHGFTPHITLSYVPLDAPTPSPAILPPDLEFTFDEVCVAWGNEHYFFSGKGLKKKTGAKDYRVTRPSYIQELDALVNSAKPYGGGRNRTLWVSDMRSIISAYGPMAFLDGMRDGGAQVRSMADLSDKQREALQRAVLKQLGYVPRLANSIFRQEPAPKGQIMRRVQLWANKGLDGIYYLGVALGAGDKNLRWELGQTKKHCETCAAVNGQVHRASTWLAYGLFPRSDDCLCGGYQCDCKFVPTNERPRGSLVNIPRRQGHITEPLFWGSVW